MDEAWIRAAEAFVRELFSGNAGGHDVEHTLRVFRNAMRLADTEPGCDRTVVALGALLHDADDHKLFHSEGNANARAFLASHQVPGDMVERIVEQKDCDELQDAITECNSGFYCFDAEALFAALAQVGSDNAQGEFYLTDVIEISRNAGRAVLALQASDNTECLGINSRIQLAQATKIAQRRINEAHMMGGVTMTDPDQVWIGPDVTIAQDVELLPQVFLMGSTSVGEDCRIGPGVYLVDETIEDGSVISPR